MHVWPLKDPAEVLDYAIDWTARLDGDTITSSAWTVPAGITENSNSFSDSVAVVWLSGATANTALNISNTIQTAAGRTFKKTMRLTVQNL